MTFSDYPLPIPHNPCCHNRTHFIILAYLISITPSIIFLFLLIIISKPQQHPAQTQQRWGFNHHSNTTNLEPSDMSTLDLPGSERSPCVKKCLLERSFAVVAYLDEKLRSPPIWSQPMRLESSR